MSDQDPPGDKPFPPSPKKLEDARKKGEIPRSQDMLTAVSYGGVLAALWIFGPMMAENAGSILRPLVDSAPRLSLLAFGGRGQELAGHLVMNLPVALAPLLLIPPLFVLLTLFALRSILFTPSKIKPKLDRISPIQGAKNKFGRNGLFEFAKSFFKLAMISIILGVYLFQRLDQIISSFALDGIHVVGRMMTLALEFLSVVVSLSLLIGLVDYTWQRAEHFRKNRMTHKEMTDEAKQTEGDPHLKQTRRQKGYDIATNRMLTEVPDADVVIVNPEHYAVALAWDRGEGSAPRCVAKGVDEVAARIRETAQDAGVPLHRDPPTARAIHATVEIGQEVAPEHYKAVAAAIRFADKMQKLRRASR